MKIEKKFVTTTEDIGLTIIDYLNKKTDLSKSILKKFLDFGAIWVDEKKRNRVRRSTYTIKRSIKIEIFLDNHLLSLDSPKPKLIFEETGFGVWYKPAGLLSQGTNWGDLNSVLRQIEKIKGEAHLVHRLDKDTSGLIIIAYDKKNAAYFSKIFQERNVGKYYRAIALGEIKQDTHSIHKIETPIDGKSAETIYEIVEKNKNETILKVEIKTGRLHQIRKHLAQIGHPIIGDKLYGPKDQNSTLQLFCYQLQFKCTRNHTHNIILPSELFLF